MKRLMLATVAAAAMMVPVMALSQVRPSQGPVEQSPSTSAQTQKMQSQRDWTPEQKAARPSTHQGEEQKFGAGQPPSTVGQAPSSTPGAVKPIPEGELKPPQKETGK